MRRYFFFISFLCSLQTNAQFIFEGQVLEHNNNTPIYLSLIEDYRKGSRTYFDQIIYQTTIDSVGHFKFEGDNLSPRNRIYRIHLDTCSNGMSRTTHFLRECTESESVLFIANNNDTIVFPKTGDFESLCSVVADNTYSSVLQTVASLKDEMIFDIIDHPTEASLKLNYNKWFKILQDFGLNSKEPLVELYIFDFLSDRKNETYDHYLNDLKSNTYYDGLLERLKTTYPNTNFTKQFETELKYDRQFTATGDNASQWWCWLLYGALAISMLLNVLLLKKYREYRINGSALARLTSQEQKVIDKIVLGKTNKEIASDLFISLSTVKSHINNLYKKLSLSSRDAIIKKYRK